MAEKSEDVKKAIEYLNEYWSVGILRFFSDLKMMGVSDPKAVLRALVEKGYVELTSSGVVNATDKLPKVKKAKTLADLLGF
ncbi:MAG: hypothetical protein DRJ31_01375 [Candidatus Methanomethylicota archaeon]|uniref:ArnR1-like winged helix-turn-helix domain-containing protein n=1 Tax=Thermoproteota archaeon TaxID=2056631 RepID=A0A497ESS7_9CREN|nr:MAG: hypothetical protein DRJ31_01375 [Candidatus Verstraetearchaeota archaeon]